MTSLQSPQIKYQPFASGITQQVFEIIAPSVIRDNNRVKKGEWSEELW